MSVAPAEAALRAAGLSSRDFRGVSAVGGGCVNECACLRTRAGRFFLKWNREAGEEFFRAEAEGLAALAATETVRVPRVVARSGADDDVHWLLLEWIEREPAAAPDWGRLGRELAALHAHGRTADAPRAPSAERPAARAGAGPVPGCGWPSANFIGPLPQRNPETADWPAFWVRNRILPLVEELRAAAALSASQAQALEQAADRMRTLLRCAAADGPSLLHGDLWSGNVLFGRLGRPALADPAVYRGHREVDLAMAALFGGFDPAFRSAYQEAWPLLPGHAARLPAYQLYPLLVHARLFGGSYLGQAVSAARRVPA